jgi:membrane-associated phospholipid phosphatase
MRGALRQAPSGYARSPAPLLPTATRPVALAVSAVCLAITASLAWWVTYQTSLDELDAVVDAKAQVVLGGHQWLLRPLIRPAGPVPVAVMALALALLCLARRRYREAALVVISVPMATMLTELVLKPLVGRLMWSTLSFPSGHTTGVFAVATLLTVLLIGRSGAGLPRVARAVIALTAFVVAALAAFALVAEGVHYLTDTVAGAAVGIGTVLATALIIDVVWPATQRFLSTRRSSVR